MKLRAFLSCKVPLGNISFFSSIPLSDSPFHPIFQLGRVCWLCSGQAWQGFSLVRLLFSQPLCPAAHWAALALWPHLEALIVPLCCIVSLRACRHSLHAAGTRLGAEWLLCCSPSALPRAQSSGLSACPTGYNNRVPSAAATLSLCCKGRVTPESVPASQSMLGVERI